MIKLCKGYVTSRGRTATSSTALQIYVVYSNHYLSKCNAGNIVCYFSPALFRPAKFYFSPNPVADYQRIIGICSVQKNIKFPTSLVSYNLICHLYLNRIFNPFWFFISWENYCTLCSLMCLTKYLSKMTYEAIL